jgi:hypothetical protein
MEHYLLLEERVQAALPNLELIQDEHAKQIERRFGSLRRA